MDALSFTAVRWASVPLHRGRLGDREIPLEFWLIVVGLNETRWREQAGVDCVLNT
jgi:hypothetical protein